MSITKHITIRRSASVVVVGMLVLAGLTPVAGDAAEHPASAKPAAAARAVGASQATSSAESLMPAAATPSAPEAAQAPPAPSDTVPPGTVPGDRAIVPAAPSAVGGIGALTARSKRKVLVIPVYWSGVGKDNATTKSLAAQMKKVDTYYRTVSSGRVGLTSKVLGWAKISRPPVRCGLGPQMDHVASKAIAIAKKRGTNPSAYAHVIFYVTAEACQGQAWEAGLGSLPGRYVWLNGTADVRVVSHELGHNLGLEHANYLECYRGKVKVVIAKPSGCQILEYSDLSDAMGNGPGAGWFSGPKLARLGWLTSTQLRSNVKASSATYTLHPMAGSSRSTKVVKIKASATRTYWVEYRRRVGLDDELESSLTGVQVRVTDSRLGMPGHASAAVLDMYPFIDGSSWLGDEARVALPAGSSWTSPEGIRVTVGRSSSSSASITVRRHVARAAKPRAVPAVTAANADAALTVSWKRAADGGMPVTGYRVTATSRTTGKATTRVVRSPGGTTVKTKVGGLKNGQRYTVRVAALNEVGTGASRTAAAAVAVIRPTLSGLTPAAGVTVQGKIAVTFVPSVGKGSSATLSDVEVCLGAGYCQYVSSGLRSGKRAAVTFDSVASPWSVPLDGSARLTVKLRDSKNRTQTVARSIVIRNAPSVSVGVPTTMTDGAAITIVVTPRAGVPVPHEQVWTTVTTTYEHPDYGSSSVWTDAPWTSGNTWSGTWDQSQVYPATAATTVTARVEITVTTPYRSEAVSFVRTTKVSIPAQEV